MKTFYKKNKEIIKPLMLKCLLAIVCFIACWHLNTYLTNSIDKRLESIPIILYFVLIAFHVTKSEYKQMTVDNLGEVSLTKFEHIYEKYGYTIQLPGYLEHPDDECVISYKNNKDKDCVLGITAFHLFNQYIKIPFVFDYRKDRMIIKSKKAVINLKEISIKDWEEFNPNISNLLKLEYKISFDKRKLILFVSDGSKYDRRLNYRTIESLKALKQSSYFLIREQLSR